MRTSFIDHTGRLTKAKSDIRQRLGRLGVGQMLIVSFVEWKKAGYSKTTEFSSLLCQYGRIKKGSPLFGKKFKQEERHDLGGWVVERIK
jgi:hypothetical protein